MSGSDEGTGTTGGAGGTTGAGAEAAEGLHGARERERGEDQPSTRTRTSDTGVRDDGRRKGSEPLRHRDSTHESGYGGRGGEPRKGS